MKGVNLLAGCALIFAAGTVSAQSPPPYGMSVGIDAARKIMAGAEAEAKKNNWNVAIAIVDTGGHLVLFERLDGTQVGSVQVAQDKARTANNFRRPTKVFEDAIAGGRVSLLGLSGATPVDGGLPIVVDGKIVGGIGVSGVTSQQDAQIAKAGLDAMK